MKSWLCIAILTALASTLATGRATAGHSLGLSIGVPTSIGVLWNVSDRLGLRPDLSISHGSSSSSGGSFDFTSSSTSLRAGLSALAYLGRPDPLRFYLRPRGGLIRTSSSQGINGGEAKRVDSGPDVSVSLGAQYALHDRFCVRGDFGIDYQSVKTSSPVTSKSKSAGSISEVGISVVF